MSDIVERLRANMDKYPGFENMNTEAATEIERLREEVKRWKAEAMAWRNMPHLDHIRGSYWEEVDMKALDAARAANGEVGQ